MQRPKTWRGQTVSRSTRPPTTWRSSATRQNWPPMAARSCVMTRAGRSLTFFRVMACPIQPPVQAALIGVAGVFLTAIVTLLTNRSKLRQDRELALRKDVYLELLDAIAEAGVMISALLQEETNVADAQRAIRQLGGAVAKMQIVAPAEIESSAFELQLALNKAFGFAIAHRKKLGIYWARTQMWRDHLDAVLSDSRSLAHGRPLPPMTQADAEEIERRLQESRVFADQAKQDERYVFVEGMLQLSNLIKEVIATSPRLIAGAREDLGLEKALKRYEARASMIIDLMDRELQTVAPPTNTHPDAGEGS